MTEKNPLIAEVVKRKSRGETYTKISEDLGISRKGLYNLRGTDAYIEAVNQIYADLMAGIDKFTNSGIPTQEIEALKERGRVLRALLPSLAVVQHKKDPEERRRLTVEETMEKRRRSEALILSLDLSAEQLRKLEDMVQSEELE